MALIKCTECAHDVSDKASSCPHCGAPIATLAIVGAPVGAPVSTHTAAPVVPIEQTGKTYKGQMLGGAVLACVGIVVAIGGAPAVGILMMVGGVVLYYVGRAGAWWNHG